MEGLLIHLWRSQGTEEFSGGSERSGAEQLRSVQGVNHPGCVSICFYFGWNIIIYLDLLQQFFHFLKTDILLFCKFKPHSHFRVLHWLINRTAD